MKRKYSEISKPPLTVYKPSTLPCDVCQVPVRYEFCPGSCVYCSMDCYEVIYLSKKTGFLHEKDDKDLSTIKKSKSFDDLMKLDG